jgi:hypothetical protein
VAGSPYAIQQGTLSAGTNYSLTFVGANFTITAAPLTVTADDKTMERNQTIPSLTGTIIGQKFGEEFTATYTTDADGRSFGEFPIVASNAVGAGIENYNVSYVNGTLTVVAARIQACTPGFWQGGSGAAWWNVANDPDWVNASFAQPYTHATLFFGRTNPYTSPFARNRVPTTDIPNSMTMFQIISSGGTSNSAQRAARSVIAAYLNASYNATYPWSRAEIVSRWNAAANISNAAQRNSALDDLHRDLDPINNEFDCRK